MQKKKRIAAYIRVSTGLQAEKGMSLEDQRRETSAFCKHKGYKLVATYEDAGFSGNRTDDRPEFTRMMKDVREGTFDGIVSTSLSRLFRNTQEALEFSNELRKRNVDLILLKENVDTKTPTGRLFFAFMSAFYEFELELTKERTMAGKRQATLEGRWAWGRSSEPFGYLWNKEKGVFTVIPEEIAAVKRIFELLLAGKSLRKIADQLRLEAHPTKFGGKWRASTVEKIAKNRIYSQPKVMRPGAKPVEAPPIIPVRDQERAVELIDSRKFRMRRRPRSDRVLSGLGYCFECGRKLSVKTVRNEKGRTHSYYVCAGKLEDKRSCSSPYINAETADYYVWEQMRQILLNLPGVMDVYSSVDKRRKGELKKEQKAIEKKLATIKKQMERAVKRSLEMEDGAFKEIFEKEATSLEQQLYELTKRHGTVRNELDEIENQGGEVKAFSKEMLKYQVFDKLGTINKEKRREALEVLCKGEIHIDWDKVKGSPFPGSFKMNVQIGRFWEWLKSEGLMS